MSKSFSAKAILLLFVCVLSFAHEAEARKVKSRSGYMSEDGCCFTIVTIYSYNPLQSLGFAE